MEKQAFKQFFGNQKRKVNNGMFRCNGWFAGQRARVPPDPIPNSEVKPCSVSSCSVVLGHVNLGKLATTFSFLPKIIRVDLA